ncbi:hypothetical protein [Heliorestis convoluta]|nr:hypothetical protein [Heliorestis convoluta]
MTKIENSTQETEIAWQSKDIVLKAVAETFKGKSLEVLGIDVAPVVEMLPTALPVVEAKEKRIDFVFKLADNTLLHLEFQTTIPDDELRRFAYYGARIVERHALPVHTAVVYAGKINRAPERLVMGSLNYQVSNVFMSDFNGDEELRILKEKIERGEKLDDLDMQKLIFLPMMFSQKKDEAALAVEAVELAKQIESEVLQAFTVACIVAITDRILPDEVKKRILEVLKMTKIEQWIREEGREEGRAEGRVEGRVEGKSEGLQESICKYLEARFGTGSIDLQKEVRGITDLEKLNKILDSIYRVGTVKEAKKLIV